MLPRDGARIPTLPTVLRFDPHIFAIVARLITIVPDGGKHVPEDLQRGSAQDRRVARYCRVVQHSVARLSQHRVDLQLRTLLYNARASINQNPPMCEGGAGKRTKTYLEERLEALLCGLFLEALLLFGTEVARLFGLLYLVENSLEFNCRPQSRHAAERR